MSRRRRADSKAPDSVSDVHRGGPLPPPPRRWWWLAASAALLALWIAALAALAFISW